MEDMFQLRPHVQLMKRSVDVLRFLAQEGRLSPALFDAVWASSRSSFRDQAVAVSLPPSLSLAVHRCRTLSSGHWHCFFTSC